MDEKFLVLHFGCRRGCDCHGCDLRFFEVSDEVGRSKSLLERGCFGRVVRRLFRVVRFPFRAVDLQRVDARRADFGNRFIAFYAIDITCSVGDLADKKGFEEKIKMRAKVVNTISVGDAPGGITFRKAEIR